MKKIGIFTISFYQSFISTALKSILGINRFCRFEETCSSYTKRVIQEKGLIRGSAMGLARILKCQPFYDLG